jgi:hypothetical protein
VLSPQGLALQNEIRSSLVSSIRIILLAATLTRTERTGKNIVTRWHLLPGVAWRDAISASSAAGKNTAPRNPVKKSKACFHMPRRFLDASVEKGKDGRRKIGWVRADTYEQNLDLQRDALEQAGWDKILVDKASGAAP